MYFIRVVKLLLLLAVCITFLFLCFWLLTNNNFKSGPHILLLGDSITSGNKRIYSYRRDLWRLLENAGHSVNFVGKQRSWIYKNTLITDFDADHEGHWGFEINQINDHLAAWLQHYPFDIALVHLGTNDISRSQSIESTLQDLRRTIEILRHANENVIIFLAQIIPIQGHDVSNFNQEIPTLANQLANENSPIIVVDQETGFDEKTMLLDKFHPNSLGEKTIARNWFMALDNNLSLNATYQNYIW